MQIITGNDMRIAPDTTDGTDALAKFFIVACKRRSVVGVTDAVVNVQHTRALLGNARFPSRNALTVFACSVDFVRFMAMGFPSHAAITGSWIRIVVIPFAAIGLDSWIDYTTGVPPISRTQVSRGTISLTAALVFETPRPDFLVYLDGTFGTNSRRISKILFQTHLAIATTVAFRSGTTIATIFALVVPRDAAFVVGAGVGHTGGVIL